VISIDIVTSVNVQALGVKLHYLVKIVLIEDTFIYCLLDLKQYCVDFMPNNINWVHIQLFLMLYYHYHYIILDITHI